MAKFKVRARTIDMLGRQQIAGLPTAISELFKNAHDAYADFAEVDYFREDGLFILRDDGLGMTREEFETRWLTVGTESKLGKTSLSPPPVDPSKKRRPMLGEKGIGRLAIAIIGPQVLIVSRARRDDLVSAKTVVAYIHWGVFELPGLDLDSIEIPVEEIEGGNLPDAAFVGRLVANAQSNLEDISTEASAAEVKRIKREMKKFKVDPQELQSALPELDSSNKDFGTHFYILPADDILQDDIDNRENDKKATRFEKSLIGFTNTMTPNHPRPPILTRFRDYHHLGDPNELIGERAFFTPEEYERVDHHVIGEFDEYGTFKGKVGIYQMPPDDYTLAWQGSDGSKTKCGPFKLSFAYMQGSLKDSLVTPEEHVRMKTKLDRHGGLYIFQDGIRVQPYGDSDYDWLEIERNRTLSAGYYFYSYRRMFGVVELFRNKNKHLTEKAGREGFRENLAYRQMRSILMNFFVQTAGDFFREEGKYAKIHLEKKEELNKEEILRAKRKKQVRPKLNQFKADLERVFDAFDDREPELKIQKLLDGSTSEAKAILRRNKTSSQKAMALVDLEDKTRAKIRSLREQYRVTRPRGVGLPKNVARGWQSYQEQYREITSTVFNAAEHSVGEQISLVARNANVPLDETARVKRATDSAVDYSDKAISDQIKDIKSSSSDVGEKVKKIAEESKARIEKEIDKVRADLVRIGTQSSSDPTTSRQREEILNGLEDAAKREKEHLEPISDLLLNLSNYLDSNEDSSVDVAAALEESVYLLEEGREQDLELVQIGMALNAVNHEFEKSVGSLRNGLKELKSWADANEDLSGLYDSIRNSFDHLDQYLTLFTPLDRRIHRKKIEITGGQIYEFLAGLFETRLERHDVQLIVQPSFAKASVISFPSSIYPAFVNLVDNSIFWLQQIHGRPREISLDGNDDGDLFVRDNGPGISRRDFDNIFAMRFSRKPAGRGMGLTISRETLLKDGFDLTLMKPEAGRTTGASFKISKLET